jgi:hypothetical protein
LGVILINLNPRLVKTELIRVYFNILKLKVIEVKRAKSASLDQTMTIVEEFKVFLASYE